MQIEIGKIQTIVGTGEEGYAGDGGPALECMIGESYGCAFDADDNLYICDGRNHTVRRFDKTTQIITTVAGTGEAGYPGDGGPVTEATMDNPHSCLLFTSDAAADVPLFDSAGSRIIINTLL